MSRVELIEPVAITTAEGIEVTIRFEWYRSLPLSCFQIRFFLDGEEVPQDRMRLHLNDRDYELAELPALFEEFWFVLDGGRLRIRGAYPPGDHEAKLQISMRIPYLFDEETGEVVTMLGGHERLIEILAPQPVMSGGSR